MRTCAGGILCMRGQWDQHLQQKVRYMICTLFLTDAMYLTPHRTNGQTKHCASPHPHPSIGSIGSTPPTGSTARASSHHLPSTSTSSSTGYMSCLSTGSWSSWTILTSQTPAQQPSFRCRACQEGAHPQACSQIQRGFDGYRLGCGGVESFEGEKRSKGEGESETSATG